MAQKQYHYEEAFEHYLRQRQIPYVSVDEARKALDGPTTLKNFDFVVYSHEGPNLLVDIKGRKHSGRTGRQFQNWVTEEDVTDMLRWQRVFGEGFAATLVFIYWCAAQPPDALFLDLFQHRDRWYAVKGVMVADYERSMKPRSERWGTVDLPARTFERVSRSLSELIGRPG